MGRLHYLVPFKSNVNTFLCKSLVASSVMIQTFGSHVQVASLTLLLFGKQSVFVLQLGRNEQDLGGPTFVFVNLPLSFSTRNLLYKTTQEQYRPM